MIHIILVVFIAFLALMLGMSIGAYLTTATAEAEVKKAHKRADLAERRCEAEVIIVKPASRPG